MDMSPSLQPLPRGNLQQKQTQRLIMLPEMQQAIHFLQLPLMELKSAVEEQLMQNPLLDWEEKTRDSEEEESETPSFEEELCFEDQDFSALSRLEEEMEGGICQTDSYTQSENTAEEKQKKEYLESRIQSPFSLYEYLMNQAKESFEKKKDLAIAEEIIGNLEENGLFTTPLEDVATNAKTSVKKAQEVLAVIQGFDPPGIAASTLQACLLMQLAKLGKTSTLAYKILEMGFTDLIHNKIPKLKKALDCSQEEINKAIQDIAKLDLHPGTFREPTVAQPIMPDVILKQEELGIRIEVNEDPLPPIKLNAEYMRLLKSGGQTRQDKEFLQRNLTAAKWLLRNIYQRGETLKKITHFLLDKQKEFFFSPEGKLSPLTMQEMASALELHTSTIARGVSGKYIQTPKGLFPLKSFFTVKYTTEQGEEISSKTVQGALMRLIERENKKRPLSDLALSKALEDIGIPCARRTIAKYRSLLGIGPAKHRRTF